MSLPKILNTSNGAESMRMVDWDFERAELEEVRRAMGLHAIADVVRQSVSTVSYGVLALHGEVTGAENRITLLDEYHTGRTDYERAATRFNNFDLLNADAAAEACGLSFAEFARRATRFIIDVEREKPGFLARAKAVSAQEDLASRRALWMTDIQPWGDENYRDYGVPDEE
jgi:hypothetical protein